MDVPKISEVANDDSLLEAAESAFMAQGPQPLIKDTGPRKSSNHWPSDEQPQLASQAEDMASLLLSNSSGSAISERLQRFAKDVGNLEGRASKYQSTIQRLQVQLQNLTEVGSGQLVAQLREEIRRLREENETLHSAVKSNTLKQKIPASQVPGEPGWVTVNNLMENNTETMSMMLYPDSPLMKRIDELQNINAKLFQANKDWHTKWEQLRQSKQAEKEDLAKSLEAANEEIQKLRAEIVSLQSKAKEEKDKVGNSRHKEKDAQIGLLKEQLTVFMQDFEKEKREKKLFQEKFQKKDKEYERLRIEHDKRVNALQTEVRLGEEKLKANKKDIRGLQFRVAELMDEVKEQKQRGHNATSRAASTSATIASATAASATTESATTASAKQPFIAQHQQGTSPSSSTSSQVYPSSTGSSLAKLYGSQFGIGHRQGPEELPGAWTCPDCTYINYPDRTVCDICGYKKTFDDLTGFSDVGELHSRGPSIFGQGLTLPDSVSEVEIDSSMDSTISFLQIK
ncbi:hypothetical protein EGW08_003981 [Elysia chlorotica]|uniref:RanBP2-type domain-containing protein n=1 Tax=Elysia chlorotica TaxID=188477 RepID=A0A3S1BPB8_ELYCH|nr:hypothetical protein EGW08_003981 [Elysia chlorotica]